MMPGRAVCRFRADSDSSEGVDSSEDTSDEDDDSSGDVYTSGGSGGRYYLGAFPSVRGGTCCPARPWLPRLGKAIAGSDRTASFTKTTMKELVQRGFAKEDMDWLFRSRWQTDIVDARVRLGAQVLLLYAACYAVRYGAPLFRVLFQDCFTMDMYVDTVFGGIDRAIFELFWLGLAVGMLLYCRKHPGSILYSPAVFLFLAFSLLCYKIPPLGVSCKESTVPNCRSNLWVTLFNSTAACADEQDASCFIGCDTDGFDVLLVNMGTIWITPFLFTSSTRMSQFLWAWTGLFYALCALSASRLKIPDEDLEKALYEANVDLMVGVLFLCLMNVRSLSTKARMQHLEKKLFLADLEYVKVAKKMFDILTFMVPEFVIFDLLKSPGETIAAHVDRVSILFVVFAGFDKIAHKLSPEQLLLFLNSYFTQFDSICAARHVLKIETVSEEYVCAVGVDPADREQEAISGHKVLLGKLIHVACDFLHLPEYNRADDSVALQMGIHTGPIVGGVVGHKLPRFRLFGDTINTTARMMQRGLPGEVQFGKETLDQLPSWALECARSRGQVEMKGKGWVDTFLLDHREIRRRRDSRAGTEVESLRTAFAVSSPAGRSRGSPYAPSTATPMNGPLTRSTMQPPLLPPALGVVGQLLDVGPLARGATFTSDPETVDKFEEFLGEMSSPRASDNLEEIEAEFQSWFHEFCFLRNIEVRLLVTAALLVALTVLELSYLNILNSSKTLFTMAEKIIFSFVVCRLLCMAVICVWLVVLYCTDWVHRFTILSQWCMALSCYIGSLLLLASYMYLPFLFQVNTHSNTAETSFPLTGVSTNMLFLMWLPSTLFLARINPTRFRPALAVALLTIALIFQKKNIVVAFRKYLEPEGHALQMLSPWTFVLLNSLPLINAYAEERSWRARCLSNRYVRLCRTRVEDILDTLMPPMVVDDLRRNPLATSLPSHRYQKATVIQSDITGFTRLASTRLPAEVVGIISELFGLYDELTEVYAVYKVETVGDAYIAARAEEPLTASCLPLAVLRFGLSMVRATHEWSAGRVDDVDCRVGVHFGECVGGVVGVDMQRYHLFGELMHVVEVLESTSLPGRVQVSSACREAVEVQLALGPEFLGERLDCDGGSLHFDKRAGEELRTSKGEVFSLSSVGGPTFLVSDPARSP